MKENNPDLFDTYNEIIYRAFWDEEKDISDLGVLAALVEKMDINKDNFLQAITDKKYANQITPFKNAAYADGITHLTTFRYLGEQCSEAPYATINEMAIRYITWCGG